MTRAQAIDAAWKPLIGLVAVGVATWAWSWLGTVNEIVQAWPDVKAAVEANDVYFED